MLCTRYNLLSTLNSLSSTGRRRIYYLDIKEYSPRITIVLRWKL